MSYYKVCFEIDHNITLRDLTIKKSYDIIYNKFSPVLILKRELNPLFCCNLIVKLKIEQNEDKIQSGINLTTEWKQI